MIHKLMSIAFGLLFCLSLASCLTRVDSALPYAELPQITLATEVKLIASPSHPTAYLSSTAVPAGASVTLLGATQDMSWLLVLHEQMVGWMPTFFLRDNVGTLTPALTFTLRTDQCTSYVGATFAPDEAWTSIAEGAITVIGVIYRPAAQPNFAQSTLTIAIDGAGQAVDADYVHVNLTSTSSLVLFTYALTNLQKGSQISFALAEDGNEPLIFEAAYFSDSCAETQRFTAQLPVGAPKGLAVQPVATPACQPTATVQPAGTSIVHISDARTPTPTPTPTPSPTLDSTLYGAIIPISVATASSFYAGQDHLPSDVIDGDIKSYWISKIGDDIGAWVEVQLAEPALLVGIRIYSPGVSSGNGLAKDLSLYFSDGSQQNINLGETAGWYYKNFPPITTESVKAVVDSVHNFSPVSTTRLYEIQLLGAPIPPMALDTANAAVSIRLRSGHAEADATVGQMKAGFLKQDGQVMNGITFNLFALEKDIGGDWLRTDTVVQGQAPDEHGFYQVDLAPQHYLLTIVTPTGDDEPVVPGWYSDAGYVDTDQEQYRGIIFPVEAGKTTEIAVHFSRLVVGVLDESGKAVRGDDHPGWMVAVCADTLADVVDEALRCARQSIDRRGAAAFQLAPGAYHLRVLTDAACYWEFPVNIGLQETKEARVTINTAQPDACPDGK